MGRALGGGVVAVLLAAGAASAATITLGRGIGPWKLAQRYVQRSGLVRSVRYPANDGPGCVAGAASASRIDYYRTIRVAWRGTGAGGRLYLIDVATTAAGDRSGDRFTVGLSRLVEVRRSHPRAAFAYAKGRLALGASSVTLVRTSGSEGFTSFVYWFDARGVLTALETLAGGC